MGVGSIALPTYLGRIPTAVKSQSTSPLVFSIHRLIVCGFISTAGEFLNFITLCVSEHKGFFVLLEPWHKRVGV